VQPYGIGILPDELVHIHSFNRRGATNSLLLAVDEDGHELRFAAGFSLLLCAR
jgi:hypothetical protein